MLLHILAHVKPDQGILISEHGLAQCAAQFSFANTGRPEEYKRTQGPLRILKPSPGAPDRPADCRDSLVLADNPFMQGVFQLHQAGGLRHGHPLHGNARPGGHHVGHILFPHHRAQGFLLLVPGRALAFHIVPHFALPVSEGSRLFIVLLGNGIPLIPQNALKRRRQFTEVQGRFSCAQAHPGRRFVHQVHSLVGQLAVIDIAAGKTHGGFQRRVADFHPVVRLIPGAEPL